MKDLSLALSCVAPIFLLMCAGYFIRLTNLFPEKLFDQLSSLCFRFFIPCLLFCNIYSADLDATFSPKLIFFLEGELLLWFIFNLFLFTQLEKDCRRRGAYIQASYRSNIAVIGVTLAQSLMGVEGVAVVTLAASILVPTYNVLAVITLEICRGGRFSPCQMVKNIVTNPLIVSCTLGICVLALGIKLPVQLEQTLADLGSAGSTLTLVALGASLRIQGLECNAKRLIWCSAYRLFVAPLVALTAAVLLGFREESIAAALICSATPMGSSSYPMALVYGSDHELTGQLIVSTAILCPFTLFLWILLLKRTGLI